MKTCNTGFFMSPQNFSVNDGDGIRTIIFFAGCPLKCKWCSNPESQSCNNCLVKEYSVEQLLKIIERQEIFYRNSGGGVTFSGGEATLNQDILRKLTNTLYDRAINLAIETSGYFNFEEIKDILEKMDLIFVDIKHMDESKHIIFTGKSNKIILNNINKMNDLNVPIVVRIPVIEGVNADDFNISETAEFVKENIDNPKIELLPYHSFGDEKYEALGIEKPSRAFKTPPVDRLKKLRKLIEEQGVKVVSYS
ncbi:glycyl-radical enzyme activating protein [Sedimentibacter sp.]|uniref:glycyl-radical enzyme activating protein n=1 Tax=Sedimentibacter sp. TaxID=1960295 RepID=UPI0028ABB2AC|nr:glycyl-radical enzyme activating protein [Sedimentibacter sp.]